MKRSLLLAAAVPLIVLPGLMSGTAAAGVPTAAGASVVPATDPAPPVDLSKAIADFVGCLKDHGVDVPLPASGEPLLVEAGPGDDAERAAIEACTPDLPPPSTAVPAGNPDELKPFAQCMRENGVPDFPDPTEKGLVIEKDRAGSPVHPGDPAFDSAQEACDDKLPAPPPGAEKGSRGVGVHNVRVGEGGPGDGPGIAVSIGGEPAPGAVAHV